MLYKGSTYFWGNTWQNSEWLQWFGDLFLNTTLLGGLWIKRPPSKFSSSLSVSGQQHSEKDRCYFLKVFKQMQVLNLFRWNHYTTEANFFSQACHLEWETCTTGYFSFSLFNTRIYILCFHAGCWGGILPQIRHTQAVEHCNLPPSGGWCDELGEETTTLDVSWWCTTPLDLWLTTVWFKCVRNDSWKLSVPVELWEYEAVAKVLTQLKSLALRLCLDELMLGSIHVGLFFYLLV